jgi:hypothetical protein
VAKEKKQMEMSPVGQAIWLHMQRHNPPYNRSSLARKLTENGTFPITAASVSNYLGREHPPPEFINAVVHTLDLSPHQEAELHMLFFRGKARRTHFETSDAGRTPTPEEAKRERLSRSIAHLEDSLKDARAAAYAGDEDAVEHVRTLEDMINSLTAQRDALGDAAERKREKAVWRT